MKRLLPAAGVVVAVGLLAAPLYAGARVEEKTSMKFFGGFGKLMNTFGGEATRDGLVQTMAVHGDRMKTMAGDTGQIIELAEEMIYALDLKRGTYRVTTFAEFREQMRQAQEALMQGAGGAEGGDPGGGVPAAVWVAEVDVRPTGLEETIHDFDTRQVQVVVTVHQRGMTLEQGGGAVLTADLRVGPRLAAMDEVADFNRRYVEKLDLFGADQAQQLAQILMASPALRQAMAEFGKHQGELEGTPIRTTLALESVANPNAPEAGGPPSLGGLLKGLGKPGKKREGEPAGAERKPRFTSTTEVLSATPSANAADVALPPGLERKGS